VLVQGGRGNRRLGIFAASLAALACALSVPAVASAVTYTVDSTGDEADALVGTAGCLTAGGKCTLRAAIQESNSSTGVRDEIKFAAAFNGEAADTIALGPSFPVIADPVTIDGDGAGQCATAAGVNGPCAGVSGPSGGFGLVVEDDDVTIEGLAVTGALIGIDVINGSEGFTASDNWVGVKLDGSAGANNTGIFIDPGSDEAVIGGAEAAERNVIADNNLEGLDIEGASQAVVRGNYFGVSPNGAGQAANAKDIEITDSTSGGGFKAVENQVGANVSLAASESGACDGGCNVISGSISTGIDLQGNGAGQNEAPASGPTTIHGNYVGLNAAGTSAIQNATTGILVGGADEALIGGSGGGEQNHINGGTAGVSAGIGANDLIVDNNLIGLDPAGTETLAPPTANGIFDSSEGIIDETHAAEISDNRISMLGGIGIEQHSIGALITGNHIGRGVNGEILSGGTTGIKLWAPDGAGSTVEANVIENSEENGLLIENENNLVIGNVVEGSGAAGIRLKGFAVGLPAAGNVIGGDEESEENAIADSGGDAIEIVEEEDTDNQVRRNFGDNNGGLFIDLGADGSGNAVSGPNAGIQAPTISAAKLTGASGSGAEPNATVRVFRKATASPGELASFLGETEANGGGNWSVTYASAIPGDTQIAATQTGFEGTSELAFAKTEPAPKSPGGGNQGGGGGTKDTTPPETRITKGPKAKTRSRKAKFKFSSSEPGSKFECKLDRKRFKRCSSPKTYKGLKPGKHVFKVRAVDKAGNVDPTPAKKKFKVLP
jgi:CSLREA domain-containing protein